VSGLVQQIISILLQLGVAGLFGLAVIDSSLVFFAPLGIDLLLIALAASNPERLAVYVFAASLGSLVGCFFTDVISRKGGEQGLVKRVSPKRLDFVKRKVTKRAGPALAMAALVPPPFPFTPFVAVAAALQYSRKRLLAAVAIGRVLRFTVVGLLAVQFGRGILNIAESPAFQAVILGFFAMVVIGTALSIVRWVRRSKHEEPEPRREWEPVSEAE
jgi:membrane protein YqaA with SNARE-associated domain